MTSLSLFVGRTRDAYLNRYAAYTVSVTAVIATLTTGVWLAVRPMWWVIDCRYTSGFCDSDGAIAAWLATSLLYLGMYLPLLGFGAAYTGYRTVAQNRSRWRRLLVSVAVACLSCVQFAAAATVLLVAADLRVVPDGIGFAVLFVVVAALPMVETAGFTIWRRRTTYR